ncbi:hypothetical protein AB0O07_23730 [Streptomyces sp. NPDC093085]|uniref:hypothetical protein n=1 Tax=Streptomyces sp. NPDC093085 TaxID=3155068 RepID=UPI003448CA8D
MNTGPFYRLTVVCEGPVNGTWVRVVLAARQAASPDRTLSFLRCQALRIADGLDPDPQSLWAPRGTLVPVGLPVPDAPTELRCWCDDFVAQEKARNQLLAGTEFTFRAADHTGRYLLTALPVPAPALSARSSLSPPALPALPSSPAPPAFRHSRPGRRRHRKPRWYDRFRPRRRPGRIRVAARLGPRACSRGQPVPPLLTTALD